MNAHSQASAAISRVHDNLSHEFYLYNYDYDAEGGSNPYADGEFVETDDSPVSVQGRVERRDESDVSDEAGVDVEAEATLFLLHDTPVQLAQNQDGEARSTEFVDTQTGSRYSAVDVEHQDDLLAVLVEEL